MTFKVSSILLRQINSYMTDNWDSILTILSSNVYYMNNVDFYGHSDADMLEVGNGGLNHEQERTHFALWAAMKSPLLIGADLTKISAASVDILKSKQLLTFHQDEKFGKPATPFRWNWQYDLKNPPAYWAGQFSGGTMLWLFNSSPKAKGMSVGLSEIPTLPAAKSYKIVDGWSGDSLQCVQAGSVIQLSQVLAFDTAILILTPGEC
jgi:alpha-galactosidase